MDREGLRERRGVFQFSAPQQIDAEALLCRPRNTWQDKAMFAQHLSVSLRTRGFPCSSVGKASACSAGDPGSIPDLGRSPGEGNGNPLQYSCLENPMDRGAWRATVRGVTRVEHDLATKPPLRTKQNPESNLFRKQNSDSGFIH